MILLCARPFLLVRKSPLVPLPLPAGGLTIILVGASSSLPSSYLLTTLIIFLFTRTTGREPVYSEFMIAMIIFRIAVSDIEGAVDNDCCCVVV